MTIHVSAETYERISRIGDLLLPTGYLNVLLSQDALINVALDVLFGVVESCDPERGMFRPKKDEPADSGFVSFS